MTKKILIVGPAWVGDMVMAQTLFIYLKSLQDCEIDVIAPKWSEPLLDRMPEVRNAFALGIGHGKLMLKERYHAAKSLRTQRYDQAILCPNSFKSALLPFWAKIAVRTGWMGEYRYGLLNDIRKLDKQKYPLMIERFMALALENKEPLRNHEHIHPKLVVDETEVSKALSKFNLDKNSGPILALCPGAEFGPAKRWPDAHYAEVAQQKQKEGWQVWLFGSPKDKSVSDAINQATNNQCHDLTGNTSLAEAIDLLSLANMVVSNDSGLMHIAAALNRNLVVVYGSTSPKFTPPLNEKKEILQLNLSCSPCFDRQCRFDHLNCLNDLQPKLVLDAITRLG